MKSFCVACALLFFPGFSAAQDLPSVDADALTSPAVVNPFRAALQPLAIWKEFAPRAPSIDALPYKLCLDLPEKSMAAVDAGVGLARRLTESARAGLEWRASRNTSIGDVDEFDRHVVGLYFKLEFR